MQEYPYAFVNLQHGEPDTDDQSKLKNQILRALCYADLLFAWIDTSDCYGTIAEIGLFRGCHYHRPIPRRSLEAALERQNIHLMPRPYGLRRMRHLRRIFRHDTQLWVAAPRNPSILTISRQNIHLTPVPKSLRHLRRMRRSFGYLQSRVCAHTRARARGTDNAKFVASVASVAKQIFTVLYSSPLGPASAEHHRPCDTCDGCDAFSGIRKHFAR